MKKPIRVVALFAALLGIIASSSTAARADFILPHQYVEQDFDTTLDGGYYEAVAGQEDLTNPNQLAYDSVNNQYSFINKEMWLNVSKSTDHTCNFGANHCWLEAGDTAGGLQTSTGVTAWAGHYFAIARNDGTYYEEPIGTSGVTGTHTFEIAYGTNGIWEIYIDGALSRQISSMSYFGSGDGYSLHAGIESDNTNNTYKSGTYEDALQYRYNSGSGVTWYYWDPVGPYSSDNLTYINGAHSTYSASSNPTATFY